MEPSISVDGQISGQPKWYQKYPMIHDFYHRVLAIPRWLLTPTKKWKITILETNTWSSSIPIFYFRDSWKKNARFPVHQQFQLGGSFKPFEKYYSNWKSTWHNPYILACIDHFPKLPFGICASAIYLDLKVNIVKMASSSPSFGGKNHPATKSAPWSVPPNRHVQHQQWPPAFRCPGDSLRCLSRFTPRGFRLRFTNGELAGKKFQRGLSLSSDKYSKKQKRTPKP